MNKTNNLDHLQQAAFTKPIVKTHQIDQLLKNLSQVRHGDGYILIAQASADKINFGAKIITDMTGENVSSITMDMYKVENNDHLLAQYKDALSYVENTDSSIFHANTVDNIKIENTVSFGDMFSRTYQNYNMLSHVKIIDSHNNIPDSEKDIFFDQTINPVAICVDLEEDFLKNQLLEKVDLVIFKMQSTSQQKLEKALDVYSGVKKPPVFVCHAIDEDIDDVKTTTTKFIETCREQGFHPGGFAYQRDDFDEMMPRLADDLVRPVINKKEIATEKENVVLAKNPAWS